MRLSYTAGENDQGRTVGSILRSEMCLSAAMIRRLKRTCDVRVSGKPVYVSYAVTAGETVTAELGGVEPPCGCVPEKGALEILYENEGLLAVNKPAGLLVHPSRSKYTGTLSNIVAGYLEERCGNAGVHAVNRLDRDTSGVVLFAKNSYMKARAAEALSRSEAFREYTALVHGTAPEYGTINAPIRRLEERNMLRVIHEDGQRAVTHYEREQIIRTDAGCISRLKLRLETGRTHQIRVHMLYAGFPVLGDGLYSTGDSNRVSIRLGFNSQMLHAVRLGFTEPLSGGYIVLTAAVPEPFLVIENGQNVLNLS